MTLIALPNYEALQCPMAAGAQETLLNSMGAYLKANSVDGDTAARIGDERFGLVHEAGLDLEELQQKIGGFTREADPTGEGIVVEAATIEVYPSTASDEDLGNGLVYAINKFRNAEGSDFNFQQLSTNLSSLVSQAANSVKAFKKVVADAEFEVALQPIIDVMSGQVHHYESVVRFVFADGEQSPYEKIVFAEETGLIQEFDLAMAHKVVEWLDRSPRNSKTSVVVNVSGHSVASLYYMNGRHKLLTENLWLRGQLLFEITESARMTDLAAANELIQKSRGEGFPFASTTSAPGPPTSSTSRPWKWAWSNSTARPGATPRKRSRARRFPSPWSACAAISGSKLSPKLWTTRKASCSSANAASSMCRATSSASPTGTSRLSRSCVARPSFPSGEYRGVFNRRGSWFRRRAR